jgi:tRNA (guanine-N7-)-methyltransferase
VRARHKRWAAPFLAEHPELVKESLPIDSAFYAQSPLYLEIGAGKGDFVIQMASRGGHWLALERDVSISGLLAKKVLASALPNVILMRVDFDEVAPTLKEGAFAGIYLNFSDPWPKKKHWKRRLTSEPRLRAMTRLLTKDGAIYVKTDNDSLYAFTQDEALKAGLKIVQKDDNYVLNEATDAMTEYEKNFREAGLPIHRLVLTRGE